MAYATAPARPIPRWAGLPLSRLQEARGDPGSSCRVQTFTMQDRKDLKGFVCRVRVGMVVASRATLSAAARLSGGGWCRGRDGGGGVTELRGGSPVQALNASALALKSYLGLACDPLGGLVAVPASSATCLALPWLARPRTPPWPVSKVTFRLMKSWKR